jgi:3-oxoacyl-[acyl-carrier protein] reductase
MLLKNKNAVIYGGGGAVGAAVAKVFAAEGARVFLAGRTLSKLETVARSVRELGGNIDVAMVDALDQQQVERHLEKISDVAGGIDIAFNGIGINDTQGLPVFEMPYDQFALPVITAIKTHYVTGSALVSHMRVKAAGVILSITANAARVPYPNAGGFGIACAAIEAYCRQLAAEAGQYGIRVACIRSAGSPDAPGVDEVFTLHAKNAGITREEFETGFATRTMLKRLPRLHEIANTAVLIASDKASAITAAVINVTCGELAD